MKTFEGEHITVEREEDGWIHFNFMCNFTCVSIPDDFANEVVEDFKNWVKTLKGRK